MGGKRASSPAKYWIPLKRSRYKKPARQKIKEYKIYRKGELYKVLPAKSKNLVAWMVADIKEKENYLREFRVIQVDQCSDGTIREIVLV